MENSGDDLTHRNSYKCGGQNNRNTCQCKALKVTEKHKIRVENHHISAISQMSGS